MPISWDQHWFYTPSPWWYLAVPQHRALVLSAVLPASSLRQGVVVLCAYICYCIHWFHHGDGDYQVGIGETQVLWQRLAWHPQVEWGWWEKHDMPMIEENNWFLMLIHAANPTTRPQLFSDNFMEQVTNVSGVQEEDKEDGWGSNLSLFGAKWIYITFSEGAGAPDYTHEWMDNLWHSIRPLAAWKTMKKLADTSVTDKWLEVHLMHGLTMVGMSGCNSLGFFLTQSLGVNRRSPRKGHQKWLRQATSRAGDSNPLPVISAVMIIAGLFRVFYSLYRFLKLLSGKARMADFFELRNYRCFWSSRSWNLQRGWSWTLGGDLRPGKIRSNSCQFHQSPNCSTTFCMFD